ncbi:MAG: hypothetical protein Q9162_003187 [Coniocarpon cinnabarinum]
MAMPSPAEMAFQQEHAGDTRVPDMMVAFVFSLAVTHIAIALRFLARRVKQQPYKWDDWIILISAAVTSAYIGVMMGLTRLGYGHHAVTVKDPASLAMGLLIAELLYSISICLIKTSTLFFIHRVFASPALKPYLWAVGILIHAYSLVLAGYARALHPHLDRLYCHERDERPHRLTAAGNANAFPMEIEHELAKKGPDQYSIWNNVNGGIWSAIESGVGTLCACLPTFGVLFTALRDRSRKSGYQYRLDDTEHASKSAGQNDGNALFSRPGKEVTFTVQEEPTSAPRDRGFGEEGFALGEMGTRARAEGVNVPVRPTSRSWYRERTTL